MIRRDEIGIIVQHNSAYLTYRDAGDSASRTGLMAMAGSEVDKQLLWQFLTKDKELIRHPIDPKWSDPLLTSRDQLVNWAGGAATLPKKWDNIVIFAALKKYSESNFINKDVLLPETRLFLYKCAGLQAPFWIKMLGYSLFFIKLVYNTKINPGIEQNQMISMCSVYGKWWMRKLKAWHPDLERNLVEYWGGDEWRNQIEINVAISNYIQRIIN